MSTSSIYIAPNYLPSFSDEKIDQGSDPGGAKRIAQVAIKQIFATRSKEPPKPSYNVDHRDLFDNKKETNDLATFLDKKAVRDEIKELLPRRKALSPEQMHLLFGVKVVVIDHQNSHSMSSPASQPQPTREPQPSSVPSYSTPYSKKDMIKIEELADSQPSPQSSSDDESSSI